MPPKPLSNINLCKQLHCDISLKFEYEKADNRGGRDQVAEKGDDPQSPIDAFF